MASDVGTLISAELKPTYIAQPNERFATTFLSMQNRDYAVIGESLMDKATGEIFAKRTADGRVVSFFQNKKYMHELMLTLKILTSNNPAFVFDETVTSASYTNTSAYVNVDYDLISTQSEDVSKVDIKNVTNITFPTSSTKTYQMVKFVVDGKSNGFFVRPTTRDTDKAPISYITGRYINEREQSIDLSAKNYNAVITYVVTCYSPSNAGQVVGTYTKTANVLINSDTFVQFPTDVMGTGDGRREVAITKIDVSRYRTMYNNIITNDSKYNQIAYADNHIYLYYLNIGYFAATPSSYLVLLGNEQIIAMLDANSTMDYLEKVTRLAVNPSMVRAVERPGNRTWTKYNLWAEDIREVSNNGQTVTMNETEVDISALEDFLANNVINTTTKKLLRSIEAGGLSDADYVRLGTDDNSVYTSAEIDRMMSSFDENMRNTIDNLVSMNDNNVTDEGLYVQQLSSEEER